MLLLHYKKVNKKVNKFAFKLAMSETVDLFLLTRPCCPVEHWTDILWERDVGKTYPHSLVEPSCHNPFENYWELPICWPETWKYENDKQINPNYWTKYWKLKLRNVFVLVLTSPTVELPPCPRSLLKKGKELEACWPCLELFAPFTACTYSYLWYSQGKYLTLNRPLICSSSTNTHNPSCLPLICASLKKNVQSMFWRGLILVLLYPYLIKSKFFLLTSR